VFPAVLARGSEPWDRRGLIFGAASLAVVVVLDALFGRQANLTAAYVIAPFLAALLGGPFATVSVSGLAIAFAAISSGWNMDFGETDYYVRLSVVALGGALAMVGSWALSRSRANMRGLEVLDAVGDIADGSLPLGETMRRVTEAIVPNLADMCMVDVIHGGEVMRSAVRAGGHPMADQFERGLRARPPSVPGWLVAGDRAWRNIPRFLPRMKEEDIRRLAHSEADFDFLRSLGPRSSISVPLAARGRNLGALTLVTAWSRRRYTSGDVRFAQILASRVAMALDNAGLFSDLESVERRMDAVMSNLSEAVLVHDATGKMVFANSAAAEFLGYDSPETLLDAPREEVLSRYLILDEEGLALPERAAITSRMSRGMLPWHDVLRIVSPSTGEEHWVILHSVAIAGDDGEPLYAVTTVEDVTEVKQAEFAQGLLASVGELFASSADYLTTLQAVAELAVPRFADWCAVILVTEKEGAETVAIAHRDPEKKRVGRELVDRYGALMGDELVAEVVHSRHPALAQDVGTKLAEGAIDEEHRRLLSRVGIDSMMIVPMTAGAKVLGVLAFADERETGPFNENDFALASEIARRAGIAVENARLARDQAEMAAVLQRGLRPPEMPSMPGWESATMYRPAGELNEVGGDFYDAFAFAGGWMIVVGDVLGRGTAAASLTALARYTLRTAGALTGDPATALRMLDRSLKERPGMALCTVALMVIGDEREGPATATVYSAGHPKPLRVRDRDVEEVGGGGPMPGAVEEPRWDGAEVTLLEGDHLILYTDGVIEARGEDDRFGETRLREQLAGVADPAAAVARIEGALQTFLTGPAEDDAAAVVIQRVGAVVGPPESATDAVAVG